MNKTEQTDAPEISEQTTALVKKFQREIERELDRHKDRFKQFQKNREHYRGVTTTPGKLVRTNLIFSTIATIYPQVYAKNPDMSFAPAEAVGDDQYDEIKRYGKTTEVVLQRMLVREGNLKGRVKAVTRAAMLCQVGWLKVTYQKDMREDPEIKNRMNDIQDDIERLRAAAVTLDEANQDHDLRLAEMQAQLDGMRQSQETVVSSGLVIDKLMSEDVVILDPTVRDFDDYKNASRIAQRTWMDSDMFRQRFKRDPSSKAQTWSGSSIQKATQGEGNAGTSAADKEAEFCAVWEIWDKTTQTVYTWCEGEDDWCREAFQPKCVGRRWYPFFGLCFNPVDGELYGISDVELLVGLQEEYTSTRDALAKHRKYSIPLRVVRSGGSLTPQDVQNLKDAEYGDTVIVSGDSSVPLTNDVTTVEGPPINPALYDVSMIRTDIEMVSGASDASRGMVAQAKTATEAEIMQQGLASRTGERQDIIEDMIEDMAKYSVEVLTGELTTPEVIRFAGNDAVWPQGGQMDQVFDVLNLEIRAGSTGKPNKNGEREQWIQLMPILQDAIQKVTELRATGQNDMADAITELTRESLRRFDERIDLDSFIPRKKEGQPDPAQQAMESQQKDMQLQQAGQMVQELQAKLQEATKALESKQAEYNFKTQQADLDRQNARQMKQMEIDGKATEQGVTKALTMNDQMVARLQQIETFLQSMPAPEAEGEDKDEGAEREQLLNEVRAMITQMQPPAPINVTVPVTVEGRGTVTKMGKATPNPDGSFTMQMIEQEAGGDQ
jgi:hypothetical protein